MSHRAEIKQYVLSEFAPDVRADELDDELNLLDNGIVESLGLLRLIAWVGKRFGIPVDELTLSPHQFRSINAIDEFVASQAAETVA